MMFLLVITLVAAAAQAVDVTCTADAMVSTTDTTTAYGGDSLVFMTSASDVLLLAFPPASQTVIAATLVIPRFGGSLGDSYNVTVTALVDSWDESTATYADTGSGAWTNVGVVDPEATTATTSFVGATDAVSVSVNVTAIVTDVGWLPQRGLAVQFATAGEPLWSVTMRESSGGVYAPYLSEEYETTTTPWVSPAPPTTTTTTTPTTTTVTATTTTTTAASQYETPAPVPVPYHDISMTNAVAIVGAITCVLVVGLFLYVIVLRRPRVKEYRMIQRDTDTMEMM